jgi:hypothetical protein
VAPFARHVAPAPDPVIKVTRELPHLTLLEAAFMRIGFTEHGARQLCLIDGENF